MLCLMKEAEHFWCYKSDTKQVYAVYGIAAGKVYLNWQARLAAGRRVNESEGQQWISKYV